MNCGINGIEAVDSYQKQIELLQSQIQEKDELMKKQQEQNSVLVDCFPNL